MGAPDAERIVKMLGCIPLENREDVLEDLLGLHPLNPMREAARKASKVQAALTSKEQSKIKYRGKEFPLRALVHAEPGKFWAFETGVDGNEILVLLLDDELFDDKSHTAAYARGAWDYFIFKTREDYLARFGEEPRGPELKPEPAPDSGRGCSRLLLFALVVAVVGFVGLSGLVSQCSKDGDHAGNGGGATTPAPKSDDGLSDVDEGREALDLPPDMSDEDVSRPSADCSGADEKMCGELCVNIQKDPRHCGECVRTCGNGKVCMFGVCECPEYKIDDECKRMSDYDKVVHLSICTEGSIFCGPRDLQFKYGEYEEECRDFAVEPPEEFSDENGILKTIDDIISIKESTVLEVHSTIPDARASSAYFEMTNFYTSGRHELKVCGFFEDPDGGKIDMKKTLAVGVRYKCRQDEIQHNGQCCREVERIYESTLDYKSPKCDQGTGDNIALSDCKSFFGFKYKIHIKEEQGRWKIERLDSSKKQQRCRISGDYTCLFRTYKCAGTGPLFSGWPLEIRSTIRRTLPE